MKPLDFVKIKTDDKEVSSAIGIITECNTTSASVEWIGDSTKLGLKTAWWFENELEVVDNLPRIISNSMAHPFGSNKKQGDYFFPKN